MRKRKAINLLKKQKDIFESESYDERDVWFQKTASLIELFFGRDSNEYYSISNFEFRVKTANPGNVEFKEAYKSKKRLMIGLLNNCIEKLEISGLYKPPKNNILSTYNNWVLLTIAVAIFTAGLYAGIWLSETKSFSLYPDLNSSVNNHQQ